MDGFAMHSIRTMNDMKHVRKIDEQNHSTCKYKWSGKIWQGDLDFWSQTSCVGSLISWSLIFNISDKIDYSEIRESKVDIYIINL